MTLLSGSEPIALTFEDEIELKLMFEAISTMRMTATQRCEMAAMTGATEGDLMFLRDKAERYAKLETKVLRIMNPEATRLKSDGEEEKTT